MTPFSRLGGEGQGPRLIAGACQLALQDAGVEYRRLQAAYVGYVQGETAQGQHGLYQLGMTGIPVVNVNNAGATGATALYLAAQSIAQGGAECVLAVGVEHSATPAAHERWPDVGSPMEQHLRSLAERQGVDPSVPLIVQLYGGVAREYLSRYGGRKETLAMIAVKAREHASRNPHALFNEPLSLEQVLAAPELCSPLTRPQCCSPATGAAAAILCSDEFLRRQGRRQSTVRIVARAMLSEFAGAFAGDSLITAAGHDMAIAAARQVYEQAGVGPEDLDLCEIDDCFSANEVLLYEALGLCKEGDAERFVEDGDNSYGGNLVVNPSGGLLGRGHPHGATGLAQCVELVWQLRGAAQHRQVENARLALQHNLGLGSACVAMIYRRD